MRLRSAMDLPLLCAAVGTTFTPPLFVLSSLLEENDDEPLLEVVGESPSLYETFLGGGGCGTVVERCVATPVDEFCVKPAMVMHCSNTVHRKRERGVVSMFSVNALESCKSGGVARRESLIIAQDIYIRGFMSDRSTYTI
jgi:hypothetical protein